MNGRNEQFKSLIKALDKCGYEVLEIKEEDRFGRRLCVVVRADLKEKA